HAAVARPGSVRLLIGGFSSVFRQGPASCRALLFADLEPEWMALRPTEDIQAGVSTVKLKSAAAGIVLCLITGTVVLAQDGHDQTPPSDQQAPAEKPAEKPKCVTSNTAWKEKGKSMLFEIELQNTCDQRLKCTVDAFVIGSRGQAQG